MSRGNNKKMSYDISLRDKKGNTIELSKSHDLKGGTYDMGGTNEAWLNVTYNYGVHYYRVFGEKGIRTIYGMTGAESIPVIEKAIEELGDDIDNDYWKPTEGNAKAALKNLLELAKVAPEGIWDGD